MINPGLGKKVKIKKMNQKRTIRVMGLLTLVAAGQIMAHPFSPQQTKPTGKNISVSLTWGPINGKQNGFIMQGLWLKNKENSNVVLSTVSSATFLGAKKISGSTGTGKWGISDCSTSNGCTPGTQATFELGGKTYTGTNAKIDFLVSVDDSASSVDNNKARLVFDDEETEENPLEQTAKPKLNLTLLQGPGTNSPYPTGPYGRLGLGPGSPFFKYWRTKHKINSSQNVMFVMSYKARNNTIKNLVDAAERKGALTGTTVTFHQTESDPYLSFTLLSNKNYWGFASAGFGIKLPGNGDLENSVGGITCVYPEGNFYFAVKNKTKFDALTEALNQKICGQKTTCSSKVDVNKAPNLGFYQSNGNSSYSYKILPESYLMLDGDNLRTLITQDDELFATGGDCDTAQIAVGRLFLYENEVGYYVDATGRRGKYYARSINQIVQKTSGNLLIIIVILLVVVLIGAVAAFFFFRKNDPEVYEKGGVSDGQGGEDEYAKEN